MNFGLGQRVLAIAAHSLDLLAAIGWQALINP